MRFQPPTALTVEAVCIVIQYGVEGRWNLVVLSTVDTVLYHCGERVPPSVPVVLREEVMTGMFCHSQCEEC